MWRMKEIGRYSLLVLLIGLLGRYPAMAAERVALVIGNSEYAGAPYLNNPQRDAQAIARALTGIGFQVTGPLLNQSKTQMEAALGRFGQQAQGATAAVVYFAGHGVEVGGQNYLLPTDAVLDRESDASLRAVALNVVLDQMGGVSDYRLVILDACRDNPMANTMRRADGTRSASRGLAPIDPSGQTYVAYAARAGQRAKDGEAGDHSPYAAALLKYLPQSGLPLERLFGAVREEVLRTTTRTQEPALYGAFGSEPIYLAGPGAVAPIASAPAPVVAAPPPAPTVDHDYEAWKSAEKCGTAACFEAYLEDYPKGRYAKMARARLKPVPESRPITALELTHRRDEIDKLCKVFLSGKLIFNIDCEYSYPINLIGNFKFSQGNFSQVFVFQEMPMGNACNGGPLYFIEIQVNGNYKVSEPLDFCGGQDPIVKLEGDSVIVTFPESAPNHGVSGQRNILAQQWRYRNGEFKEFIKVR